MLGLEGYETNVEQYLCEGFHRYFQVLCQGEINNSPV